MDELVHYQAESPVLTVYLSLDQSNSANLNRGFETALKNLIQNVESEVTEDQKDIFRQSSKRIMEFTSALVPTERSLVCVSDAQGDFFWEKRLNVALENGAYWNHRPYVRPLLEVRDEFERCGVILTDRGQARMFSIHQGEIEEHREAFAEAEVSRQNASGTDQLLSQAGMQRKSDEHARWHLKNVAEKAGQLGRKHRFGRLVLAGTPEALAELKSHLTDELTKMVVGSLSLSVDASERKILEEVAKLEREVERIGEKETVLELVTAAAKNQKAVIGLEATLETAWEQRIRELVYAEGFRPAGGECTSCRALLAGEFETCPKCQGNVNVLTDVVELVVERVVSQGGKVEEVRGSAAEVLSAEGGGIGAFLHF